MRWDMGVPACLLVFTFSFLLHHSCKFVVLSRLICLHPHGFVAKEEIEPKVSGANWGVNVANAHGLAEQLQSSEGGRLGGLVCFCRHFNLHCMCGWIFLEWHRYLGYS